MSEIDEIIDLGFYGKLPGYGDFIQKRLPSDFINPWHEWLQAGMLACRERDPQGWMTYYLNCPAWSFVLSSGICGQQAVAGVTIPSVDRVGRYFNFTMASLLPEDVSPALFASKHADWFSGLENLALSILEEEMDQDAIDRSIHEQAAELIWQSPVNSLVDAGVEFLRVKTGNSMSVRDALPELTHQMAIASHERYGLWWHGGSSQVSAQLLSCANMPPADIYLGLMMDDDVIPAEEFEDTSKPAEVNYMDELLSE